MRFLTLREVIDLHRILISKFGGSFGVRDQGSLASSVAQPQMTFGGQDLYPTLGEKSAALAFSLIKNHSFIDGNKRIGHAALEVFLILDGFELDAPIDEQEKVILEVASSAITRDQFAAWVSAKMRPQGTPHP